MAKSKGYETLRADLKSGAVKNVYLFFGEEAYLREHYTDMLRKALVPAGFEEFNYHRLQGKDLQVEELTEVTEAMPMMAQRTFVTVTDMDIFKLDEQQRTALIALLEDVPAYCTLLFIYDVLPYKRDGKMKKLTAELDKNVCEVEFTRQGRSELTSWVRRHFAALGHDIDERTIDHLLFTCGSLMTKLQTEIEKIGAYAKQKIITIEDINAVADQELDAKVWDMTDMVAEGRFDAAAQKLSELLQMQEEPIKILGAVGMKLRQLYTARMALDNGKDYRWLQKTWSMSSDYPAKLMMKAAAKVDHDWCRRAVLRCGKADRRMKGEGSRSSEEELKTLLMELAGTR